MTDSQTNSPVLKAAGRPVGRYVTSHRLPARLSPRPYLHPVTTLAGTAVTELTPADHTHHLGVGVAVPDVEGHNFWGGRTYVRDQGPTELDNHGAQHHVVAIKFGSGTGNLVTGARLYNNSDDGIDLWSFSSPVTIEHTWSFGNGVNRWGDSAFEGNGNGFKLGGNGVTVAHVVNNSAAWGNAGNGFTENSNTGAIVINRTTAYANSKWGYYFATSAARLGKNLAVSNGSGLVTKGSSVVSAGNNWDSGISTPSFVSTDASTTYNARKSDGSLPATTFLTTGSTTIGATMN